MTGGPLSWQESLFPAGSGPDMSFERLVRHRLDEESWIDVVPGWLHDHGDLFDLLRERAPWQQRKRPMYERLVDEPRLVAVWPEPARHLPERVERIRRTLSEHYGVDFDSVLVNLYRDGRDSVAWHGDTVRRRLDRAVVATVSLGHRRRFLLRHGTSGPVVRSFEPGEGDLLVMGGRCQHEWQHTVPKTARCAGARMSITLRHSQPLGAEVARSPTGQPG